MAQTQTRKACQAVILNVGDELLDGIRSNAHLVWLGEQLARRGVRVIRGSVVRDEAEKIAAEIAHAWEDANLIVTTGGMGPTRDDLVRQAVASALGLKLVHNADAEATLRERFVRLRREVSPGDLRQCLLPEGAELIPNPRGTSPGIYLSHQGRTLVMLPGPGLELRPMFEEEVVPRLCSCGAANEGEAYVQIRTFGIGAVPLENLVRPHLLDGMTLTFGTHTGIVDARISAGESGACCDRMLDVARKVRDSVGDDFICTGHACLATLLVEQLTAMGCTVALGESCTGGLLASAFTDVPGASKVLTGSAVCYSNDAKMNMLGIPSCIISQHGAVSAECAAAMATAAAEKFGADYGLSVTGYAGPGGGTEEDPVGTIYFGYASPSGVWTRRVVLVGDRLQVKARAVNTALDWMRRNLSCYGVEDKLHGA